MLVHDGIDAFFSRQSFGSAQRVEVGLLRERSFLLRRDHRLLAKISQHALPLAFVELNDFLERMNGDFWAEATEVRIQVGFEFIKHYLVFGRAKLSMRGQIGGIDNRRARLL